MCIACLYSLHQGFNEVYPNKKVNIFKSFQTNKFDKIQIQFQKKVVFQF